MHKVPRPKPIPFEHISENEYFICENQGDLFNLAQKMGFDDDDFIKEYMNSVFCQREMDAPYSVFQMGEPEDVMDYTLKEITPRKNLQHYNTNAIQWIGYMYRYMHIRTGIDSSVLYEKLPLKDMLAYYIGMHTQDDEYFLDILKEQNILEVKL